MTHAHEGDDGSVEPTDRTSFETALTVLCQQARENDVEIEGAWAVITETDLSEQWDVVVARVTGGSH